MSDNRTVAIAHSTWARFLCDNPTLVEVEARGCVQSHSYWLVLQECLDAISGLINPPRGDERGLMASLAPHISLFALHLLALVLLVKVILVGEEALFLYVFEGAVLKST